MTTTYQKIRGPGLLFALPPEVRERIYDAYFAERRVEDIYDPAKTPYVFYRRLYDCNLLLASRAIYDEASVAEQKPGVTFITRMSEFSSPPRLRHLITRLEFVDFYYRQPLQFADYPALSEIHVDLEFEIEEIEHYGGLAAFDEVQKGSKDPRIIAKMQSHWEYLVTHPLQPAFDWRDVPAGIKVKIPFVMYGDVPTYRNPDDEKLNLPGRKHHENLFVSPPIRSNRTVQV